MIAIPPDVIVELPVCNVGHQILIEYLEKASGHQNTEIIL
jgi:hypothetical protein